MFILINDIPYNIYNLSSFNKGSDIITNPDNTQIIVYCINYQASNGTALKETFDNENARDAAYDKLVEKLVIDESGD